MCVSRCVSRLLAGVLCTLAGVLAAPAAVALAAAPEPPEVSVQNPVGVSEAVVQGVLNPNGPGEAGSYEFLYKQGGECEGGSKTPQPAGLAFGLEREEVSPETLVGLRPGTQYTVCLLARDSEGASVSGPVSFVTAPETPETTSPAASVTTSSAVLEGVLNPKSPEDPGSYEFLYRQSASECEGESTTGGEASTGVEAQAVEAKVSGLLAHATYTFCLLARNEAGETARGRAVTFTTGSVKATIDAAASENVTESSAELAARINPNGTQTSYEIEYGTSNTYSQSTPVAPVGAGRQDVQVSQMITGLEPEMTYHWRVLATNTAGTSVSVDQTFVYLPNTGSLPDGRQYEQVTPPQKNASLIGGSFGNASDWSPHVAEDGAAVVAHAIQCFGGVQSCIAERKSEGEPYEFARTSSGWETRPLAPPASFEEDTFWGIDAGEHTVLFSGVAPGSQEDFYARDSNGTITNIGPVSETPPDGSSRASGKISPEQFDATADLSHIAYNARGIWSLDGELEAEESIYEYVGADNSTPLLVGVSGGPESTALIATCGTVLGGGEFSGVAQKYGSLSSDGRIVYFLATGAHGCVGTGVVNATLEVPVFELFARVDGEGPEAHTVAISQPKAPETLSTTPADENCTSTECQKDIGEQANWRSATFAGASTDGSSVFFTSEQQLTNQAAQGTGATKECSDSGSDCNLYLYDSDEPAGHELIDASAGSATPEVQEALAISPDGSHVYFIAKGVLAGSEENQNHEHATPGEENLYVYAQAEGKPRFVATLDQSDPSIQGAAPGIGFANVTSEGPEGSYLVFMSHKALTPDDTRPEGPVQVYRYDAQTRTLLRVSIGAQGFNDDGNTDTGNASIALAFRGFPVVAGTANADPTMSSNGRYVFFESPIALAPGAINDFEIGHEGSKILYAQNVYEWETDGTDSCVQAGGCVSLITDGKDLSSKSLTIEDPVELLGSNAKGNDVFFSTYDQLSPEDTDTQLDYYDAHICSTTEPCINPTPPPPPPCQEEACHSPNGEALISSPPSSQTFTGSGNFVPAPEVAVKKAVVKKTVKCAKGKHSSKGKCVKTKPKKKKKK
jgi:hypothetical protein